MKKTILAIDDFETSRFVIATTLHAKGYEVIKASSGIEALKHLNGQKIDLVITDYNMPNMNGLELVEKIKSMPEYTKTPIFILSTETKQEVKDKARDLGVTAWVKKPFVLEKLITFIERII